MTPAERPPQHSFGDADRVRDHLEQLQAHPQVAITREGDQLRLRAVVEPPSTPPPEGAAGPLPVRLRVVGEPFDASWQSRAVWLAYRFADQQWSFRSVVREVHGETVTIDAPAEIRPFEPPLGGAVGDAEPGSETDAAAVLTVGRRTPPEVQTLLREVKGGDFFLHDTRRGHHINHPARVRSAIAEADSEGRGVVTIAGVPGVYAVAIKADRISEYEYGLDVRYLDRTPEPGPIRTGTQVVVTLAARRELLSLPCKLFASVDDGMVLNEPREVWRYPKRAAPRYLVDTMGFSLTIDHDGLEQGQVHDLSLGGLGADFESGEPPPTGRACSLRLNLSGEQSLELQALVANVRRDEGGPWRVGFLLEQLDARKLRILSRIIQRYGRLE